jgi:hypothetical protein
VIKLLILNPLITSKFQSTKSSFLKKQKIAKKFQLHLTILLFMFMQTKYSTLKHNVSSQVKDKNQWHNNNKGPNSLNHQFWWKFQFKSPLFSFVKQGYLVSSPLLIKLRFWSPLWPTLWIILLSKTLTILLKQIVRLHHCYIVINAPLLAQKLPTH